MLKLEVVLVVGNVWQKKMVFVPPLEIVAGRAEEIPIKLHAIILAQIAILMNVHKEDVFGVLLPHHIVVTDRVIMGKLVQLVPVIVEPVVVEPLLPLHVHLHVPPVFHTVAAVHALQILATPSHLVLNPLNVRG